MLDKGMPVAISINSNLVSLVEDYENRLVICKLELDPVPRLQTLCFLELPPSDSGASNVFCEAITEWVPTSKSYARTRSSRGYHLPFYSSAIGTISLRFLQLPSEPYIGGSYVLIISVAALVSAIPTDVRNVPWEDWGPSCTHFYESPRRRPRSIGPFWIPDVYPDLPSLGSPVVRQYDLRRTRYTQLMPGTKSSLQSRTPFHSTWEISYDIETHLPYRDVMMENEDSSQSDYIVADREWVVRLTPLRPRGAGYSLTVYHVG